MIVEHNRKRIEERQRARWVALLGECAEATGLPADPGFRSAFAARFERGSRIAVLNSQPGAAPAPDAPTPHWGWGEFGEPHRPWTWGEVGCPCTSRARPRGLSNPTARPRAAASRPRRKSADTPSAKW